MTLPTPRFSIDLHGQTAFVSDGASGLGWRLAQILAASGAQVAVGARNAEHLSPLVQEIRDACGTAFATELDVTEPAQIVTAMMRAQNELGIVTILVNCADDPTHALATEITPEALEGILMVNLRAPYLLSCEFARALIRNKVPGRVVNIASMAAFHCKGTGDAAYSMTKSGLVRMTETLSVEWAKFNINVNAIAPGAFDFEPDDINRVEIPGPARNFPRGRIGKPSQLDSTLLYLVSPSSECVTGTCIKVDDAQLPR